MATFCDVILFYFEGSFQTETFKLFNIREDVEEEMKRDREEIKSEQLTVYKDTE